MFSKLYKLFFFCLSIKKMELKRLETILNTGEDVSDITELMETLRFKLENHNNYIGFQFHEGAFHNYKLLNTLRGIIPDILKFNAHKGSIYIILDNDARTKLCFSGDTTNDIIKKLISVKNESNK